MTAARLAWLVVALVLWVPGASADAKSASKPPPTPTPTPTPGTYRVPGTIKSNCSAPVEGKLMAWLATVPDGSTVRFAADGCYGQDGTITLTGRKGLVLDGRGAEFRALTPGGSHRANWRFVGGSDLTVQNMAVRGSDPQGAYDPSVEWQHGYSIEGVQGMTLTSVQVRETWGDGIDLWHGADSPACGDDASSARNIKISGATLERNGRQGLAVVDAEGVTLQDSTVGPVAWSSVDLETDDDCEIARDVTIDHNSFGANRYGVVASVGFGGNPQVGDVTVTDNVQTAPTGLGPPATGECWAPVRILSPDGVDRGGYTFRGNHFLARWNGFEFRRVNNVTVDANTVDYGTASGCSAGAGVLMVDSHTVAITNNLFNGAGQVFTADAASTNIDAQGNTTTTTTSSGTATAAPTATAGSTATAAPTATEPTPQGEAPEAPPSSEEQNPSPTGEPRSPRTTEPTVPAGRGGEQPADAHGPGHHSRAPGAVGP